MRFFIGAIALLAGMVAAQDCDCECKIDSCFEALAGVSPFPAQATVSDCRSYVWTVITVSASSTTITGVATATATNTVEETSWTTITVSTQSVPLQKRQGSGKVVPNYARAACPGPSDYASACKCLGITAGGTSYQIVPGTETISATQTVTETQDQTVTVTATESAVATDVYFKIRAANVAENGIYAAQYIYTRDEGSRTPPLQRLTFVNSANQGTIFRAGPDNKISGETGQPIVGDNIYDTVKEQMYLGQPVANQVAYSCVFSPTDKGVSCTYTGNGKNYIYLTATRGGVLWLYNSTAAISNEELTNEAIGPLVLEGVPI